MKKRVLLVDESLTVQKVVALTLDKARHSVSYAKSRAEAMKLVVENPPDLILVSDQVPDINVGSFPREVETWLARKAPTPPILLITAQDLREMRHYAGVLKKPFSPQTLQKLVGAHAGRDDGQPAGAPPPSAAQGNEEFEDQRLQKIFNEAFADEAKLVRETFTPDSEEEPLQPMTPAATGGHDELGADDEAAWNDRLKAGARPPAPQRPSSPAQAAPQPARPSGAPNDLWGPGATAGGRPKAAPEVLSASDSLAYKAILENEVQDKLEGGNLEEVVERVLDRILPGIVEKLVQERLDRLLKEHEQFLELKP